MPSNDIGIDLGTATILVHDPHKGLLLKEPSIVAINTHTDEIIAVGEEAQRMVGRTPAHIQAIMPLQDGVISDFSTTRAMIRYFIKKVCAKSLIKPRVVICVPSGITAIESNAVVEAATSAGARKVYLIEEPVAAAIGAGIDITKPVGNMILDIGGGTSDVAVMSFNGVVCRNSIKVAGRKLDEALIRHLRANRRLLIGDRMAEHAKIAVASALPDPKDNPSISVKGRNLVTGLPDTIQLSRAEASAAIAETLEMIVSMVKNTFEKTPPELSADLHETGIVMTGGGALLHNMDAFFSQETGLPVHIADNPVECVALGTAKAFFLLNNLNDGFITAMTTPR